jgi:restriction system protein
MTSFTVIIWRRYTNKMQNNKKFSKIDIENLLMPEIIKGLQRLGGLANKAELYDNLRENANTVIEEYMALEKVSHKTHQSYHPFEYAFNFSIKHLTLAGYISKPARANYQLTQNGYEIKDFSSFSEHVRQLSGPLWNQKKATVVVDNSQESYEEENESISWSDELLDYLKNFSPAKFEQFCRLLVHRMGVKMDEKIGIQISNDGGLDGFGYITSQDDFRTNRVAIQAKRWQGNVPSPEIDKFRGAMDKHNAEYGIFITTSHFSRSAIQAARQGTRVITLIDGDKIAELVAKYELHVKPVITYEIDNFYKNKGQ